MYALLGYVFNLGVKLRPREASRKCRRSFPTASNLDRILRRRQPSNWSPAI